MLSDEDKDLQDEAISEKLRKKLNPDYSVFRLLNEFKRYQGLLEKPQVLAAVRPNREQLLIKFVNALEGFQSQLDRNEYPENVSNVSNLINQIYHLRQMKYKVKDMQRLGEKVLTDLQSYNSFQELAEVVAHTISQEEKKLLQCWENDTSAAIRKNEITLSQDDQVIEFTEAKQMAVTYSPRLASLIEEAQQLLILGYKIPKEIRELVAEAKKFLRLAKSLDQISTFHNTIGDRMILSQRPMMLEVAVALSKMVQEQQGVKWANIQEVEAYVQKLTQVVTALAKQNNYLAKLHLYVKDKVLELFDTDLLKNPQKWKSLLKEIRKVFQDVEAQGYKNMKSWQNHWDRQLYKALEVQYLLGLFSIHENLPEINLEIIYRQQKLQFKPPLEEIRTKFYGNIRKFLSIPLNFKGVVETSNAADSIFPIIVKRYSSRFEKIYKDGEKYFVQIEKLLERFSTWTSFGSVDIDVLSNEVLKTADDWEHHFRRAKTKAQEIVKFNVSDEKIGCFVISFKLLRLDIELLNRKHWEILVMLLNNSIIRDMASVEMFLTGGIEKLQDDPQSVEEISKANALKEELAGKSLEIKAMMESIEQKNKTLSAWTRDKVDIYRLRSLWETFSSLLQNHQHIIGRQMESIKINLRNQTKIINSDVEHFKMKWDELKPKDAQVVEDASKFDQSIKFLTQMLSEWKEMKEKQQKIEESCTRLSIHKVEFPLIEDLDKDIEATRIVWDKFKAFKDELNEFENEDWIIFRSKPFRFEEFLNSWEESFRNEEKNEFIVKLINEMEKSRELINHMKYIRGENFIEKHWYELFSILGIPSKHVGELKVSDFLKVKEKIPLCIKELKELNGRAVGEITVRQALNELDAWEIEARFILMESKDSHGRRISIIEDFKSVLNKLGDNQSLLQSIRTSAYYANFADRITVWEARLADLDLYLQGLNKIQRKWIYLEPIFSHGVLDKENTHFRRIDEDYKAIMKAIEKDNRVVNLLKMPSIKNRLKTLQDQLSRCQSSLNEFLEKKRSSFPRFYFIGDDDLLEILGRSTHPSVIQTHLKKLFAGIHSVEFDEKSEHIVAMKSIEGEVVPLKSKVKITSKVETWLSELSNEMKCTLKSLLLECISDDKQNSSTPDKYPSQILCLCNSIAFTDRCEESIRSGNLMELKNELKQELDTYTRVTITDTHPCPDVLELKLKSLILDVIHEIQIVEELIENRTKHSTEWPWQKQLRYYMAEDGSAVIKMADASFNYSYEYQGNPQKLVHTPLTNKCYLSMTQAMRMGLSSNPYGPAGTGKTESVKSLGLLLGRQVLVFNCDEGIDVKSMGRIFIGLVKCGAWGCFDEFNRLNGATLSAISMQIHSIQFALKQGHKRVKLLNEDVSLDPNSGIFVTLNPAGKGYGARNKLPDNLKQLFRPVIMSQPDNERISEVILYTEGFKGAKEIGKKLVEVFSLSSKLLTPQVHYDWGLRALKTVLKGCGSALKSFKADKKIVSLKDEADVAVSTIRLNTLSKLTYSDCFRLDGLIKDIFPGVAFKNLGYLKLAEAVKDVLKEENMHVNENQVRKCMELHEQLQQRMGVVIVGPPCCGKSTILKLLEKALTKLGDVVRSHVINPKAMSKTQLLGHINLDTRQWTDGVLTLKAQQVYNEPSEIKSWIVCDGDIDPEWVEALNSVLDENHLLTLPSGWRIKFGPNVNFIFETHDLSYASPATISRMGMIFMSEEDADIEGLLQNWLIAQKEDVQNFLKPNLKENFEKCLAWVKKSAGDPLLNFPVVAIVKNTLSLMEDVDQEGALAIALIRGMSSHLQINQQQEFAKQVLQWTNQAPAFGGQQILNLYFDRDAGQIECFTNVGMLSSEGSIEQPLVQTSDVRRVTDHVRSWLENQHSFILLGPEGCGKTMLLEKAFSLVRSTDVITFYCSSLISPENILHKLSQVCITISTKTGRVFKSKDKDRLILYFKDINLVKPDKWGTCQLIEFLQQIISYGGFYDSNLEWVGVQGFQVVASITIGDGGGRYELSPRFTSLLRVCSMSSPDSDQLFSICHCYLKSLFEAEQYTKLKFNSGLTEKLSKGMIDVYNGVKSTFTPMAHSHYRFTPRDLIRWVHGLMRHDFGPDESDAKSVEGKIYSSWAYEAFRLFQDKLVSDEEKNTFKNTILRPALESFEIGQVDSFLDQKFWLSGYFWSACQNSSASLSTTGHVSLGMPETLYSVSQEEFCSVVEKAMTACSREHYEMNIVIVPELLLAIACSDKVLSSAPSSMMLAGRSGVGRKSAVMICSILHGANIFTLKVGRNYGLKNFLGDLKQVIHHSAIEGNKTYLIVEDFQLVNETFLDLLNSLISTGEIPGLYTPEELETIVVSLRELASSEGFNQSLYMFFAHRVRQFLRVILLMDYTSSEFVRRCQSNPAIYKLCSFIWFGNWSEDTLKRMPQLTLDRFYSKEGTQDEFSLLRSIRNGKCDDAFLKIYQSVHVTQRYPKRYICMVHCYANFFLERKAKIEKQMHRLEAGISKLMEAKQVVEKLKVEASTQETVLAEKQAEANKALELITITMKNANLQRNEMETLREKTLKENEILMTQKDSIDMELKEIEPLIRKAQAAVGNIKNESLYEIRSLRAPPDVIRDILEGVLRLMGIGDMSWNSMKSFLSKRGVKDEIRNFDARNINSNDRDAVEKLLRSKNSSFETKNAKRASAAAAPLADWVSANVKYSRVLEKIEPLEKKQRALEENIQLTEGQMSEIVSELTNVDDKVQELKKRLNKYTKEAAEVEFHLSKAKDTLASAEGLVVKLQGEFDRWEKELAQLQEKLRVLPQNALLAAAFITYLCGYSEDLREEYVKLWKNLIHLEDYDFSKFMTSEKDILQWHAQGLPSDQLSQENAIIILQTSLRPYLIDPSSRATEWLKKYLESETKQVTCVSLNDPKFSHVLELAVRFGKTLLIEEADIIEPILIPLLRGDLENHGSREIIAIGEKSVDFNPQFRMFLSTRNPKPVLPPESASVITVVNFTTSRAGLTSQLLSTILMNEKPEIQKKKTEVVKDIESLKIKLDQLEESLLQQLVSATGNILENKELLESLNSTKENSSKIFQSLEEASKVQEALGHEINVYQPLATFGSRLFFCITDVCKINPMYQFSLSSFATLFERTLKSAKIHSESKSRIDHLTSHLENAVFEYVCLALFKNDRLPFALYLVHVIHSGEFEGKEWDAFTNQLTVNMKPENVDNFKKEIPTWIHKNQSMALFTLKTACPDFYAKLNLEQDTLWLNFMQSKECENTVPNHLKNIATAFKFLMLVQAIRPDRLHSAMTNFCRSTLGRKSLFPLHLSLRDALRNTQASEPILIIVAPGADPSEELKELASQVVGDDNFHEIAMGQGQVNFAIDKLNDAASNGQWLCLKNLHLVTYWLEELEKRLKNIDAHEKFRLWLTTEPHMDFPNILAQSCFKIAYEAPQGLKKNMLQTLGNWSNDYFAGDRNVLRSQSLFILSLLHGVLQERRTFIPQGWSKQYEFNDSDFRSGMDVLEQLFRGSRGKGEIQWIYVKKIFENVIYGGKIDNIFDNKVLVSYLDDYFSESVLTGTNPSKRQLGCGIKVPSSSNIQEYINIVEKFPETDKASMFGLPENIERSWQKSESTSVMQKLKAKYADTVNRMLMVINYFAALARPIANKLNFERPVWNQELSPLLLWWKKLNEGQKSLSMLQQKLKPPELTEQDVEPLDSFVMLEYFNVVSFLQKVHRALGCISRTIRGVMVPSHEVVGIAHCLLKHEIPEAWSDKWCGPADPTMYLQGVVSKALAISKWKELAKEKSLLKRPVDLSDLINPETFLCAFKQTCARKLGVSMDELKFSCSWVGDQTLNENNCLLTGLMIEGCFFSGKLPSECDINTPSRTEAPNCLISWCQTNEPENKRNVLSVPLYGDDNREKIITCLDVPVPEPKSKWVQAGVALFLRSK